MRRKEYLRKKFEYYEHMKSLRNQEHKLFMERMRLEIILLQSRVRNQLAIDLTKNIIKGDKNEDTE